MIEIGNLIAKLATSVDDFESSKSLRNRVFFAEKTACYKKKKNKKRLDWDRYDSIAEHIILIDRQRFGKGSENYVVGTCRLIIGDLSNGPKHFYSNSEFTIDPLVKSQKRFLELGRVSLDQEYRNGMGLYLLWMAFMKYILGKDVETVFGVASFNGVSPHDFCHALSFLYYNHLSKDVRVVARSTGFVDLKQMAKEDIDIRIAHNQLPSLLKTYLSCGGWIGKGAFLDSTFQTLDIFVSVEKSQILRKYKIS